MILFSKILRVILIPAFILLPAAGKDRSRPTDPLRTAMVMLEEKHFAIAERIATTLLKSRNPKNRLRSRLIIAMARQGDGKYSEAIKAYNEYLDRETDEDQKDFAIRKRQECLELTTMEGPLLYDRINKLQEERLTRITGSPVKVKNEFFVVYGNNREYAEFVLKLADSMLRRLGRQIPLGKVKISKPIEIHIWPNEKQFKAVDIDKTGITSFYKDIYKIDFIQLDKEGRLSETSLDHVLPHEICHILLHEFVRQEMSEKATPLPLAINEGLSMTSEYKIDNRRVVLAGTVMADRNRKHIPLRKLLSITAYSQIEDLTLFYAQSFSFVQFLRERLSFMQLGELLVQLRQGNKFEIALQRAILMPDSDDFFPRLERAWQKYAVLQKEILESISE